MQVARRKRGAWPPGDYLFAAAGAWVLWLVANSVAAAAVELGDASEASGANSVTREAISMLFSMPGLLLMVGLQFLLTPMIVRLLRHYGLARIAIYMMLYALVWLAIMASPLADVFGMVGILRQMGWLTLFMLWGAWNWWALVQRPGSRARRDAAELRTQLPRVAPHGG